MALKVANDSPNKLRLEAKNQYCWNTEIVMLSWRALRILSFSATNMHMLATKIQNPVLHLMMWNISHKNGLMNTTAMKITKSKMEQPYPMYLTTQSQSYSGPYAGGSTISAITAMKGKNLFSKLAVSA